jgi:hypothetical protein
MASTSVTGGNGLNGMYIPIINKTGTVLNHPVGMNMGSYVKMEKEMENMEEEEEPLNLEPPRVIYFGFVVRSLIQI